MNIETDPNNVKKDEAVCPYCNRQFVSMSELTTHILTRHVQTRRLNPDKLKDLPLDAFRIDDKNNG